MTRPADGLDPKFNYSTERTVMTEAWFTKFIYAIIGAAGALLPYAFREGVVGVQADMPPEEKKAAKARAALSVFGGFIAAMTLTDLAILWLDPLLPGKAETIEYGVALFIGLIFMQAVEVVLQFWRNRGAAIISKITGVDDK